MQLKLSDSDQRYLALLRRILVGLIYPEGEWEPIEKITLADQVMELPPEILMMRKVPFDPAQRDEGRDWPALAYTMVGCKRLDNLRACVERVLSDDIAGDFLEAGVWRGGASIYARAILMVYGVTDRTIWLADSFQGMPVPTERDTAADPQRDFSRQSFLSVSEEQVRDNFRRLDLFDQKQVRFLKGWFKDTLPNAAVQRLAILRLDGDHYSSTMDTLTALYHKVSPGGFVIVDDYHTWKGCREAVDEFRAANGISAPLETVDWSGAYWRVAGTGG